MSTEQAMGTAQFAAQRRNVLVTGGAGFIGANLARLLVSENLQVTVLDSLVAGKRNYLDGLPVRFVQGDILDSELLRQLLPGHDVVHLAAQTGVPGSLADPRRDCEVNVVGTLNLLEALREAAESGMERPGRLVFASSNAPLGRQPPPASEDKAPLPISPYGASKLAGEAYCLAYHGSWGLGTVVLRFGNVYGPFSAHKKSVVAAFVSRLLAGGQISIDGDGRQTRDFIYVADLCRAILLALKSEAAGEVFQIATGIETSIQQLAELLLQISGRDAAIGYAPPRQGDIRRNYSSISKARRLLGWEPRAELQSGLRETLDWFRGQAATTAT